METLSLRLFDESDIEFAHKLTMIEGWHLIKRDIERMLNYNPSGCFIAEMKGERVGHVFSVNYGNVGWIGLLIVRAEYRRKGIGKLLMEKAMSHLLSHKVQTIKLEAVPIIANLYRKLGFIDEYDSLRISGTSKKTASTSNLNLKPLKKEIIKEIAKFDAEYFGANRIKVLTSLYEDYPKTCFVSYEENKIAGYIICRKAEDGYRLGPWVCNPENPQTAKGLLTKCVEKLQQNMKIYAAVPTVNKMAVEILREFGFEQYSKGIRMHFGKELETEHAEGMFAISGPEKG